MCSPGGILWCGRTRRACSRHGAQLELQSSQAGRLRGQGASKVSSRGGGVAKASCDAISGAGAEGGGGTVRHSRGCVLGGGGVLGSSATCGRYAGGLRKKGSRHGRASASERTGEPRCSRPGGGLIRLGFKGRVASMSSPATLTKDSEEPGELSSG